MRPISSANGVQIMGHKWGVPYDSDLDRALLACDELTGFIGACCLVLLDCFDMQFFGHKSRAAGSVVL